MSKPCISFSMEDAIEAWRHLRQGMEPMIRYGDRFEGKDLHTWDAGERILGRCNICGGFVLWQGSEFHGAEDDDSYYSDFFPVTGSEEAEAINRRWDGWEIEDYFPERYLVQDNNNAPHWTWGLKRDGGSGSKEDQTENVADTEKHGD